jgi:hypothetical protein
MLRPETHEAILAENESAIISAGQVATPRPIKTKYNNKLRLPTLAPLIFGHLQIVARKSTATIRNTLRGYVDVQKAP